MEKRGLSGIVATVLIIMLTVTAASMLFFFVVPWLRDMLDCSKISHDLQDKVSIELGDYTCYNPTDSTTRIMIKKKESGELGIIGYRILLTSSGAGKTYDIRDNTETEGVKMLGDSVLLRVPPDIGGSETYVFSGITAEYAEIMPLLEGKTCSVKSVKEKIENCGMV
jgi:flagellin-like protein